jgi:hypothetical protein
VVDKVIQLRIGSDPRAITTDTKNVYVAVPVLTEIHALPGGVQQGMVVYSVRESLAGAQTVAQLRAA